MGSRVAAALFLVVFAARAQEGADEHTQEAEKKRSWTNSTEFSLAVTEGNSNTDAFGFKNTFTRSWEEKAQLVFKADGTRTNTDDDRFRQVESGISWLPGEIPTFSNTVLIEPPKEPDVEKFFFEGRYDRTIKKNRFWQAGATWDRNKDAGILSRIVAFAGLGNLWVDRERLRFSTRYSLSYTDREEENPDPEKDAQFMGLRATWDFTKKIGPHSTLDNDFAANMSLTDTSDWAADMTTGFSVAIWGHVSLKVSLKWLYNNEPALEDIDLVARVDLVDPDGIPGTGDEFFVTTDSGGAVIELGEVRERKKALDTVFNTSLVIDF